MYLPLPTKSIVTDKLIGGTLGRAFRSGAAYKELKHDISQ